MRQHWPEATYLLETLVLKAAGQDPDGPDLMFTMGAQVLKGERKASAFRKTMEHPDAMPRDSEVTDIRVSLGEIFDQYLKDLEKANKSSWGGVTVKNLTIIVLTDGLWQGVKVKKEVDDLIVSFVQRVGQITNNVIPRRVSLQFIQFGRDLDATSRLRILDNNLKAQGIPSVYPLFSVQFD
jgi:hypothetical protein